MKSKHPWYFYYVRAAISRIWRWSPARRAALAAASVGNGKQCAICKTVVEPTTKRTTKGKLRKSSGVEVDHKIPVIDIATGLTTWDEHIKRKLDVGADALQVLCISCHKEKSIKENQQRSYRKKAA